MDINEREKVKKQYFKLLKHIGWKVAYDLDPDNKNEMFDLILFLTKTNKDADRPADRINYGFLKEAYTSDLSFEKFQDAFRNAQTGEYAKFTDKLDSRIYPFDINDIIAQCLHMGYSIEEFYKVDDRKKLTLELDPDMIAKLTELFIMKHSPLTNLAAAQKPKTLKKRSKTYFNPNPQIPKDVLRE